MHEVMSEPDVKALYEDQRPGFVGILDPIDDVLFMNYPCRDNEVMNCAIVHNSKQSSHELTSWNEPVSWTEILDTAHAFHPTARKMLKMTSHLDSDIKVHHLTKRAPLSSFVHGKAVVIGDAAHVMMPTHAAGGAVTIESAAALEVLFDKVSDERVIANRLKLFDKLRVGRCNMAMILSNSGFAGVKIPGVLEEVRRYYDGPLPPEGAMPWSTESREVFFNYDAFEEARKVLVEEKDEGDQEALSRQ
jgi:salicylate hydroxylase